MKVYKIGEFAKEINVSISTLRNWHASGKLVPFKITDGGTRYYSQKQLQDYRDKDLTKTSIYERYGISLSKLINIAREVREMHDLLVESGYETFNAWDKLEKNFMMTLSSIDDPHAVLYFNIIILLAKRGVDSEFITTCEPTLVEMNKALTHGVRFGLMKDEFDSILDSKRYVFYQKALSKFGEQALDFSTDNKYKVFFEFSISENDLFSKAFSGIDEFDNYLERTFMLEVQDYLKKFDKLENFEIDILLDLDNLDLNSRVAKQLIDYGYLTIKKGDAHVSKDFKKDLDNAKKRYFKAAPFKKG